MITHRVQPNEGLSDIVRRYGVGVAPVLEANRHKPRTTLDSGLEVFSSLAAGEPISIPTLGEAVVPTDCPGGTVNTVPGAFRNASGQCVTCPKGVQRTASYGQSNGQEWFSCVGGSAVPPSTGATPPMSTVKKAAVIGVVGVTVLGVGGWLLSKIGGSTSGRKNNPVNRSYEGSIRMRNVGLAMQNWHSSGSDPIYAVGSYYFSGKRHPDREMEERALSEIEKLSRNARHHPEWKAKDRKELKGIATFLKEVLASDVNGTRENGS